MAQEQPSFKLSEEMIHEIEEKVNNGLAEVNNGMKERLSHLSDPFFVAGWITINVRSERVNIIDPIQYDEEDEDYEYDYF